MDRENTKGAAPGPEGATAHEATSQLAEALRSMTWRVEPGLFSLAGFPDPPTAEEALYLEHPPAQIVREGGETTILAPATALEGILDRHPQAQIETDLRWVRFELAMNWDLCGFLAHVTGALAEAEVPLGAVCGFSRDHLFVAEPHLPRTREVLTRLFGPESSPGLRSRP